MMNHWCLICGDIIQSPHTYCLCSTCFEQLKKEQLRSLHAYECVTCGRPLLLEHQECAHPEGTLFVRRLFLYRFMIKDLIHLYKFHHHRNIAHVLTDLIWSELKERGLTSSVMVPVPCSRHGRKARGFDQCSLIASDLRKRYKMEVCDPLVKRTRGSTQQKRLNRAERIDCEKSRFYVNRSLKKQTAGRHVILFDDIITTGSTLTEAAGVLTACQCKEISALVLAMD